MASPAYVQLKDESVLLENCIRDLEEELNSINSKSLDNSLQVVVNNGPVNQKYMALCKKLGVAFPAKPILKVRIDYIYAMMWCLRILVLYCRV